MDPVTFLSKDPTTLSFSGSSTMTAAIFSFKMAAS
jgi:hypothetical protein